KNIDTGMGLERMAAIMQSVPTIGDIDIMLPIVQSSARAVGKSYAPGDSGDDAIRLRRIADHTRAVIFAISDGALPDRYGRGYVVRRLIRRAAIDARSLGCNVPFMHTILPDVIEQMGAVYPELVQRRTTAANVLKGEEERFGELLTQGRGLAEFQEELRSSTKEWKTEGMPADRLFYFYDTHGLPLEYMEDILANEGISADHEGFDHAMEKRRAQSRVGSKMVAEAIVFKQENLDDKMRERLRRDKVRTAFVGYDTLRTGSHISVIVVDDEYVESAEAPADILIILAQTPFYAHAGGQVGDVGRIVGARGRASVLETFYDHEFIVHRARLEEGTLSRREKVTAEVEGQNRLSTAANHTATHLLQWALRKVLGEHVHQAGSEVSHGRLRFDFTHHTALSDDELRKVEQMVNQQILSDIRVEVQTLAIDDARQQGAIALFGEKYDKTVRMVVIGEFSKELCGGTHLASTARVGLFKIVGEESVAAGVRRINALTGERAIEHLNNIETLLADVCRLLKTNPDTLRERIKNLQEQTRVLTRRLNEARSADVRTRLDEIFSRAEDAGGVSVLAQEVPGADQGALREACDLAKNKLKSVVVVLGSRAGGKVALVAAVTPDLVARGISAGDIIKQAAQKVGGGGGGRPDMAQAGGKNPDALPEALASVAQAVRAIVEA
ncbi:MAG: alanine--tRNA ligase, partial [Planctomycetia bacterium]|nr:alanine--tRNA ligase [Planctomycetia bacterium]